MNRYANDEEDSSARRKVLTLQDGARKVTFQRIHVKGTFKVRVKYVGRESWKGSRAVDSFTVG